MNRSQAPCHWAIRPVVTLLMEESKVVLLLYIMQILLVVLLPRHVPRDYPSSELREQADPLAPFPVTGNPTITGSNFCIA
jgi:hypothetical protein